MAVYILKFQTPIGSERHSANYYVGYVDDSYRPTKEAVQARLAEHRAGQGAAITRWASRHGIGFDVVALYPGKERSFERQIKRRKNTAGWLASKSAQEGRIDL